MVDARLTVILLFNTTGEESVGQKDVSRFVPGFAQRIGEIVLRESD